MRFSLVYSFVYGLMLPFFSQILPPDITLDVPVLQNRSLLASSWEFLDLPRHLPPFWSRARFFLLFYFLPDPDPEIRLLLKELYFSSPQASFWFTL